MGLRSAPIGPDCNLYVTSYADNVQNRQVAIDVNGTAEDNSWYTPDGSGTGTLTFGTGGVDDAEDAMVIWHENGHAIQDNQAPGFGDTTEGAAMGEGFGDYWAASKFAGIGPLSPDIDVLWDRWDSSASEDRLDFPPYERRLDGKRKDEHGNLFDLHYPQNMTCESHADGEIWSACLWEIRGIVGRTRADTLILESHFYLSPSAT